MAALQVRDVPDDLHEALRARARSEGKTLGEYVLGVLRRDVARPSRRQWEERLRARDPVESVDAVALLTADRRLARAPGLGVRVTAL